MDIEPDAKDWTWVLERPCTDCGFDPADFSLASVHADVSDMVVRWAAVLGRPNAKQRPNETTWSPTEYGCHVRDVFWLFNERLRKTRTLDEYRFINWDQDETAVDDNYARQNPEDVRGQIAAAAGDFIAEVERIEDPNKVAIRGIATRFTAESMTAYAMHDLRHHLVFDAAG
ncbi:MAG TPA: DinB family protein [Aeromicrobium sp.]|nr:DinB family protein [Aeromicrobium sp.]